MRSGGILQFVKGQCARFRVQGLGFRVQGLEFWVGGLEFRVYFGFKFELQGLWMLRVLVQS